MPDTTNPAPPTPNDLGPATSSEDAQSGLERERLASKSELERERYRQETQRQQREHDLRIGFAGYIYWLVAVWLVVVVCILIWQGVTPQTRLSDSVLITLLTTTTINVLGLLLTVARYLFPSPGGPPRPDKPTARESTPRRSRRSPPRSAA